MTVVLDEGRIQNELCGNPQSLFRTIDFTINEDWVSCLEDSPDIVYRTAINDHEQEGKGFYCDTEKDRFELRHVENRMDPEGGGQLELEDDRVNPVGDLVKPDVYGVSFLDSVRRMMLQVESQTLSPTWKNHPGRVPVMML